MLGRCSGGSPPTRPAGASTPNSSASYAFDRAIGWFAAAYAAQTERGHAALVGADASGRVVAATGT